MQIGNAAVRMAKEIFETDDLSEMAAKLATGMWVTVAALPYEAEEGHYKFCLVRIA